MKRKLLLLTLLVSQFVAINTVAQNIQFTDATVKALCIANWDTNYDGELSMSEAEAVEYLYNVFSHNTKIRSFDELKYFTGLKTISPVPEYYIYPELNIDSIVTAFSGCSNLTSITIPRNVTRIGDDAFIGCNSLRYVNTTDLSAWCNISFGTGFANPLVHGGYLLLNGNPIYDLEIPNGVKSIGDGAFRGYKWLSSISIPNSVISIGSDVFDNTGWYDNQPNGLLYVDNCLIGYKGERGNGTPRGEIKITEGTRVIAGYALSSFVHMTSVIIPNSVISIGKYAFQGCGLTSFSIPNGVTSIEEGTFQLCTELTAITIPNTVTSIGDGAFLGCKNITGITIPNSVKNIGDRAFDNWNNSALNSVVSLIEEPFNINDYTFCNYNTATLTVPAGTKSKYQATDGWKQFTNIVEAGGQTPQPSFEQVRDSLMNALETFVRDDYTPVSTILEREIQLPDMETGYTAVRQKLTQLEAKLAQSNLTDVQRAKITSRIDSVKTVFQQATSGKDLYKTAASMLNNVLMSYQDTYNAAMNATTIDDLTSLFSTLEQLKTSLEQIYNLIVRTRQQTPPENIHQQFASLQESIAGISAQIDQFEESNNTPTLNDNIVFADANVKAICVANWDTNQDGELSEAEAAAVTSLGEVFKANKSIKSFDELEYFTGLTAIDNAFILCNGLTHVSLPNSISSIGDKAFYGCNALRSVGNFYHITAIGNSAFYNCSSLSVLPIGDNVTRIGSYAFYGCTGYMDCPESVTYIGQGAFSSIGYNYNGIHYLGNWILGHNLSISGELIIEDGKRVIAESAFEACEELQSVTIPNSIVGIGSCAFLGCNSLHTVVSLIEEPFAIADDVFEAIGDYSIYTSATLTVPAGTKSKYQVTDGWKNFTNIVEAGGQTPQPSFEQVRDSLMNALETFVRDDYTPVNTILEREIQLPEMETGYTAVRQKLTQLEAKLAQSNLTDTQRAKITSRIDSVKTVFQQATSGKDLYKTAASMLNNVLMSYQDTYNAAMNATTIDELSPLFSTLEQLKTSIEQIYNLIVRTRQQTPPGTIHQQFASLQESIAAISAQIDQFEDSNNTPTLNDNIVFADANVKAICVANWDTNQDGELSMTEAAAVKDLRTVFQENTNITSFDELQYFTGLTSIGYHEFYECVNLTSVTIPDGVTMISNSAFYSCSSLKAVIIPNSVTEINSYAFQDCSGLTEITLSNNLRGINLSAFRGCSSLSSVSIPKSLNIICEDAFRDCSNLTSVHITDLAAWCSITFRTKNGKVDSNPFSSAHHLFLNGKEITDLVIPDSVKSIGKGAFWGNYFNSVTIPNSVVYIGERSFGNSKSLTSITIPNSVKEIGEYAFCGCSNLTSVIIPNSVRMIDNSAFSFCEKMKSVIIPNSVRNIGHSAFYGCNRLDSIVSLIEEPFKIYDEVFSTYTTAKLIVPTGTLEKYQATEGWKEFLNIVEVIESKPTVEDLIPGDGDEENNTGGNDYGSEESGVDENTDLNEKVVGSIYYCIAPEDGGYNAEEGCLVINKAATVESTETPDEESGLPSAQQGFRGLVFFVQAGRGTLKIKAETTGNLLLCVKIAGELKMSMSVEGKTTLTIPYEVSQPSEVLIYAGVAANSRGKRANGEEDALKIYSLEWESEPTGIRDASHQMDNGQLTIDNWYDLQGRKVRTHGTNLEALPKGVYIVGGKKRFVK